jgi:hypothetical protein
MLNHRHHCWSNRERQRHRHRLLRMCWESFHLANLFHRYFLDQQFLNRQTRRKLLLIHHQNRLFQQGCPM